MIFQGLFCLSNHPIRQFCTTGGNGIALLSRSTDWWATMDTASGPVVRGTSFTAIPRSIKIKIIISYTFTISTKQMRHAVRRIMSSTMTFETGDAVIIVIRLLVILMFHCDWLLRPLVKGFGCPQGFFLYY